MNLLRYIHGSRKGKAAHDLELEAMRDPFMSDAIDGFDNVRDNHVKVIEKLQKQITTKSKPESNHLKAWSIAAAILITVGTGTFFLIKNFEFPTQINNNPPPATSLPVAQTENNNDEDISADSIIQENSDALAMNQNHSTMDEEILLVTDNSNININTEEITKPELSTEERITQVPLTGITTEETAIAIDNDSMIDLGPQIPVSASPNAVLIQAPEETMQAKKVDIEITKQESVVAPPEKRIKGKVTDNDGRPIVGASVSVSGTNIRTYTDSDGNFDLAAKENSNITVNYIGFDRVTLPSKSDSPMLISMKETSTELKEVPVSQEEKKEVYDY